MYERDIQGLLWKNYPEPDYVSAFNFMPFGWEIDFCALDMNSGHLTEFEIKRTKSDFKKDFEKYKHDFYKSRYKFKKLSGKYYKGTISQYNNLYFPNNFVFVCPEGVINPSLVPDYAGLIYIYPNSDIRWMKKNPTLHTKDLRSIKLFRTFVKHLSVRKDISYSPTKS